jgi:hypothetical protein
MVPFFMIAALITNFLLVIYSGSLYFILFAQIIFYMSAALYYILVTRESDKLPLPKDKKIDAKIHSAVLLRISTLKLIPLIKFSYFFTTVNFSILIAWLNYLKGKRATFWEPSKR